LDILKTLVKSPFLNYIFKMEPDIVCKPSAFKHGSTEADIRWAFSTARYDIPVEGDADKRLLEE
jgi:hypothetical protein